jgi:protein-tyrosine phosphatase
VVKVGPVTLDHAGRRLDWPGCRNARDLGGLPTADGGRIRAGALVRSDAHDELTEAGLAALRDGRVSRIVDLRSTDEAGEHPSPFRDEPFYLLEPYIDPVRDEERDPVAEATAIATYRGGVIRNAHRIVAALTAIADAPPGTVVVHCYAGKDRTGVVVALALRLAGVADDVIAADYAYTAECLRDKHEAALAALTGEEERGVLRERQRSDPDTILAALARVDEEFGGVEPYLRAHGMSVETVARLRARLRDPDSHDHEGQRVR